MNAVERERAAAWWALVEGAAAALEQAGQGMPQGEASEAALGAATHYRNAARNLWNISVLNTGNEGRSASRSID